MRHCRRRQSLESSVERYGRPRGSLELDMVRRPPSGLQQHGTADTIDEAKAQLEPQWREWLRKAGLEEKVRGGPIDEQC